MALGHFASIKFKITVILVCVCVDVYTCLHTRAHTVLGGMTTAAQYDMASLRMRFFLVLFLEHEISCLNVCVQFHYLAMKSGV